jgi:hypothetical protein
MNEGILIYSKLIPRQSDKNRQRNTEKDELIKAAWTEFRTGKAYMSTLERLFELRIYDHVTIEMMVDFLPEQEPDTISRMPLSGSKYWIEQIDAPGWFLSYLSLDDSIAIDILGVLKEAGKKVKLKNKGIKFKKGRI